MKGQDELPYIDSSDNLSAELRRLYGIRVSKKIKNERPNLSSKFKKEVLKKSHNRCHICGDNIDYDNFQVDHITPFSLGGENNIENFIASCSFCNNYKWNYLPEEIKWILKIGVWAKTQIEFETEIGKSISNEFINYEKLRENRRKHKREPLEIDPEKFPIREKNKYSNAFKKQNK